MYDDKPPESDDLSLPEISDEQRQRMLFKKILRTKRRKEREAAGEIKELNITAMMDMMTIILVFLLKSYSATSVNMASSGDVAPPISTTRLAPRDTVAITVTRCTPPKTGESAKPCHAGQGAVLVGDKTVLSYEDDRIPARYKGGDENGVLVQPLLDALKREVDRQKYVAQYNPSSPFTGELSIVGDRNMPYRMLTEILYTAGRAELDSYRFVVIKQEGSGSAPPSGEG
jgi:biopolymer transport protein ExbD